MTTVHALTEELQRLRAESEDLVRLLETLEHQAMTEGDELSRQAIFEARSKVIAANMAFAETAHRLQIPLTAFTAPAEDDAA
ncbi:MAG: hypothetical protein ACYDBB_03035 [Armatimonadota bacterium]